MLGRKALGMKLYCGDGEDANSVFVDEVQELLSYHDYILFTLY